MILVKVLQILSTLTKDSGVAAFIMNYYRNIDKTKIQFDFLYFEKADKELIEEIVRLGGKVYFAQKPSLKHIFKTYREFNNIFKNSLNEYIAVHLHEVYLIHFISCYCKKYHIKHLITHAHTTKYSDNHISALRNKIMCLGLNNTATDFFACSKAAGNFYYGQNAVESGNVKIIANAINLEKYKFNETVRNRVRKELKIDDKFVVGHIGRMAAQKNQIFLLNVFAEVKKRNDNVVLLMIGDGALRKNLEEEILNLGLKDSVMLLGVRNDVPDLLMAMDLYVMPSLFEGLGIAAVEAQATGLKCVLSNEVPDEVNCGNCQFISLNQSIDIWSKCILQEICYRSERSSINVKINDYDIFKCSNNLQNLYLNL